MRTVTSLSFVLAMLVAVQAFADDASAGSAKAAKGARPMRTLKVDGGFIRYEVLPEDAQTPPGEIVVVAPTRAGRGSSAEVRYGDAAQGSSAGRYHADGHQHEEGHSGPHQRRPRAASDKCRDAQAKLAIRYFELEGLDVPGDLALWLQDHPSFFVELHPGTGSYVYGPTMASLVQRDSAARAYAEELARCEAAHRQR